MYPTNGLNQECKGILGGYMASPLVKKLCRSLDDLDRCIGVTRQVLEEKESSPEDLLQRMDEYSRVVTKQRSLANELEEHIDSKEWDEVRRHIKLINGLSSMIREDAQAVVAGSISEVDPLTQQKIAPLI